ncbi:hypothetical protein FACS1894153_4230 [Bacteroidia bacterium]|nr:hypothetical protein FACS1894153_4230 [Bacteroidia bacterium]
MKKVITLLCILSFALCILSAQEYHYQQGFNGSSIAGWTRTAANTTSLNHTGETFEGSNAVKFDVTCVGADQYLLAPQTANAGILTFWAQRNANGTLMDLHVVKIVNGVETEIQTFDANEFPHKNTGWTKYAVIVNETNNVKIKFYNTIREGNTGWYAIDDIELTVYSEGGDGGDGGGEAECIASVSTNFGDGTWGEVLATQPANGSFPTDTINGFILHKAAVNKASMTCPTGEKHTNRITIARKSEGGYLEFPCFLTLGVLEVHAQVGTAGNYFDLEEEVGGVWTAFGKYYPSKTTDTAFLIPVNNNYPTKMRIVNNTGGGVIIYKIKTTTYQQEQELTVSSTLPEASTTCYWNLTHEVLLKFNKDVVRGTGFILLNTDSISVDSCTIEGNTVKVPVVLTSTISGKSYTMTVRQGNFVQASNTDVKNAVYSFTFQTLKTVATPDGYESVIDINYSTDDIDWQRMDVYYPTNPERPVPLLINMHGGGWNHGEKETQGGFNTYFNMGFAVANVEYRMLGTAKAPAAVEDVRCAMKYMLAHHEEFNIDPTKIVFQGGSAGAHLALTAAYLQHDERFDGGCWDYDGEYKVIACIDKYGPSILDSFLFYGSLVKWIDDSLNNLEFIHSISPAHIVSSRQGDGIPATYIVHGNADSTVPYTQSLMLVDTLEKYNLLYKFYTVPGGGHGGFTKEYNDTINMHIVAFLTQLLQEEATDNQSPQTNDGKKKSKPIVSVSNDVVNILSDNNIKYEMYDITGKKIMTGESKSIQIGNISQGIYLLKIISDGNIFVEKIVK